MIRFCNGKGAYYELPVSQEGNQQYDKYHTEKLLVFFNLCCILPGGSETGLDFPQLESSKSPGLGMRFTTNLLYRMYSLQSISSAGFSFFSSERVCVIWSKYKKLKRQ